MCYYIINVTKLLNIIINIIYLIHTFISVNQICIIPRYLIFTKYLISFYYKNDIYSIKVYLYDKYIILIPGISKSRIMFHILIITLYFKNGMHLFVFNNILFYYYAIYAIFIICSMSLYLGGLSNDMTQLCDSCTSISITLPLQHRTCRMQFSNILCHKIFQYYKLCMLLIIVLFTKLSINSRLCKFHLSFCATQVHCNILVDINTRQLSTVLFLKTITTSKIKFVFFGIYIHIINYSKLYNIPSALITLMSDTETMHVLIIINKNKNKNKNKFISEQKNK